MHPGAMPPESAVAREIRQTRPFRTDTEEAGVALLRAASLLERYIGRVLATRGLTVEQYNVLRILRGAGDAGLPTLGIRERMIHHAPGITRLIDRLVAAGLVVRDRTGRDRRRIICRITPAGLAALDALDGPVERAADEAFAPLGADVRHFIDLLDRLRAGPIGAPTPPDGER